MTDERTEPEASGAAVPNEAGAPPASGRDRPMPPLPPLAPVASPSEAGKVAAEVAVSVPPRERARRLYVTGVAGTVEEAAAAVGVRGRTAREWCTVDGWIAERARYLEDVRRRTYSESAEVESRAQAVARRLAWRAASIGLERLVSAMEASTLPPTAFEVESLTRTALALAGVGDAEADERASKIRALPLDKVAAELRRVMGGYGAKVADLDEIAADGAAQNGHVPDPLTLPPGIPDAPHPNGKA